MERIPPAGQFYLDSPLYQEYALDSSNFLDVLRIEFFSGTFDLYCTECGEESVFTCNSSPPASADSPPADRSIESIIKNDRCLVFEAQGVRVSESESMVRGDRTFSVRFHCARNPSHFVAYFARVRRDSLAKVGQIPSLADLKTHTIKKYRKQLGEKIYREFSKAIGLNAHGIGIGAFVYLRRVLETVIETAHSAAKKESGWDEQSYCKGRVGERVQLLGARLPGPLVSNTHVYGILSRGIHELDEEECLRLFHPIELGIELILDEEVERREKDRKTKSALEALNELRHEK